MTLIVGYRFEPLLPPAGYMFLIDEQGRIIVDENGNPILVPVGST